MIGRRETKGFKRRDLVAAMDRLFDAGTIVPEAYERGRNTANKKGFVYMSPFRIEKLVSSGWQRIKRNDTYQTYLALLRRCHLEFREHELHDLEMALFANAEAECRKAMNAAGLQP
jgi:hypothetical protein